MRPCITWPLFRHCAMCAGYAPAKIRRTANYPKVFLKTKVPNATKVFNNIITPLTMCSQAKCGLASHGRYFGIVRCAPDMRRPKFEALQLIQTYPKKYPMQPTYSTIFKMTPFPHKRTSGPRGFKGESNSARPAPDYGGKVRTEAGSGTTMATRPS